MKLQATRLSRPAARVKRHLKVPQLDLRSLLLVVTPHRARVGAGLAGVGALAFLTLVVQAFTTDRLSEPGNGLRTYDLGSIHRQEAINGADIFNTDAPWLGDLELGAYTPESPLNGSFISVTVRSGDSLSLIFDRAGHSPRVLHSVVSTEHGAQLAKLYPGREIHFYNDADGRLESLRYFLSPLEHILVTQENGAYSSRQVSLTPETFPTLVQGTITSSFYMAGRASGLSDRLIMELAAVFGWDIDFALEIRRGDQFKVVYEDRYLDGAQIDPGAILAAEFINQGRSYKAVRHLDANGRSAYYTPEGESMRKAFLRTPMDVFRISSHFDPYRKHPVLNTIRSHNGTDYAAPTGTPIRAAGDGRVVSARYSSSYGNVVEIQHGENYHTLYAHMHRFAPGMREGTRVSQGQVIGYVGMTGLATGPHLHYEFRVNGVVRNPVTVPLPNGEPLKGTELAEFREAAKSVVQLLNNPALQYADGTEGASGSNLIR